MRTGRSKAVISSEKRIGPVAMLRTAPSPLGSGEPSRVSSELFANLKFSA